MGEMPESFDPSGLPNSGEMPQIPQENGILASIRSVFILILIIAIIGDVVYTVMLVVIGKKNKSKEPESVEQAHIDYNLLF